ncbi:hypothetical protein [Aliiroseovarius sp. PrR006]|uniref:hypothetical protein n=1 Tax=Aliiroseovarius sp. PrR006 TaxID=2706883 RepID=UPI0013CF9024|nr:hypothetical protein [Aliiroseovarius sp. PrR006]NDW54610.1 hypothetical protein [Aliiroseovarius sp. PrR006]
MAVTFPVFRFAYRNLGVLIGIVFPVAISAIYFFGFSTPRYVSEAQFVVRQSTSNQQFSGLNSFLRSAGLSSSADNSSIVKAYIASRAALEDLEQRIPVREHYQESGADFLSMWPSILYGESNEEFYQYFQNMISITVDSYTGVLILRVEAFSPEFAQELATNLISLSETKINEINERIVESALTTARSELKRSEEALSDSQFAVALFQQGELTLDPTHSVSLFGSLLAELNSELSKVETQIQNLRKAAPNSPNLPWLLNRSEVITDRIEQIKSEYSSEETGYTESISEFERLELQHELALKRLAVVVASYSAALSEAQRQKVFLEHFVSPNLPDKSTEPKRLTITLTVLGWASLLYLVAWLMISGLREHSVRE